MINNGKAIVDKHMSFNSNVYHYNQRRVDDSVLTRWKI